MRILLVTYLFPPQGGVGVQRVSRFSKYLPQNGVDVSVLTIEDPPGGVLDHSMLADIPKTVRVHRVCSLEPMRVVQALRRRKTRQSSSSASAVGQDISAAERGAAVEKTAVRTSGLPRWVIRLIQGFSLPDEKRLWRRPAAKAGVVAAMADKCTAIISSGPPHTAHLVAADIARSTGLPLVLDFRDPWVGNLFFTPHTPLHAAINRRLERYAITSANRVISVTESDTQCLCARYPAIDQKRFVTIRNGFDPATMPAAVETPPHSTAPNPPLVIAHMGTFQGSQSPEVILRGLELALKEGIVGRDEVSLRFIGSVPGEVVSLVNELSLFDMVVFHGFLPHRIALEHAAQADVLFLVLGDEPEMASVIPGKLPEYFALRKPILAIAQGGETAALVERSGAGLVIAPGDVSGVAACLGTLLQAKREGSLKIPDENFVSEFDCRVQTAQLVELLKAIDNEKGIK